MGGRLGQHARRSWGSADRPSHDGVRRGGRPRRNVGREKAEEAAAAIGGQAIFPVLKGDKGTDWNNLAQSQGRERAHVQLQASFKSGERQQLAQGFIEKPEVIRDVSRLPRSAPHRQQERAGLTR